MFAPNWLDMSNWGGPLTDVEAQAMKAAGIGGICVGTGPGNYGLHSSQQLTAAKAASMWGEAYHYLEYADPTTMVAREPRQWIRDGIDALHGQNPVRGWLNIEQPLQWGTLDDRINFIDLAFEVADAFYPSVGICTGAWYWNDPKYMAGSTHYASRSLWNAWYDNDPVIDGLPYGGMTVASVAVEQFAGTQDFLGQSVDLNWCYTVPVGVGGVAPKPTDPLQRMQQQLDEINAALVGRLQLMRIASGTDSTDYESMQRLLALAKTAGLAV